MLLQLLTLGCQCGNPGLPSDSDNPTPPSRPTPPPVDTAPEPPCDWVEEEPNNSAEQANPLPLEAKACGEFGNPNGDSDNWAFEITSTTWIGIDVEAEQLGSLANPAAVLLGDGMALSRQDDDSGADVSLLLPLTPDDYTLQLLEQNLTGGTDGRYFYDLQVSEQKAPRSWSGTLDEPADGVHDARVAVDGDALYGTIESATDEDWLRIDIPTGRHTLTVATTAYGEGSPLNALIQLRDESGDSLTCPSTPDCRFERGETGFENDPWASYSSEGDESVFVRFRDEDSGGSPFHWYVLDITLEASE